MKTFILYFAVIFCLGISDAAWARRVRSTTDGGWPSTGAWHSGHVPASGDTIEINFGDTVTVTSVISISGTAVVIDLEGTLLFDGGGAKLNLPSGSYVNIDSTGRLNTNCTCGGSAQLIKSGAVTLWSRSMGEVTGPTLLTPSPLPLQVLQFDAMKEESGQAQLSYQLYISGNLSEGVIFEQVLQTGQEIEIATLIEMPGLAKGIIQVAINEDVKYFQIKNQKDEILARSQFKADVRHASVQIWPNPAQGQLLNVTGIPQEIPVSLISMEGKEIQIHRIGETLTWNSDLLPGIYFLKVTFPDEPMVKQILIQ